MLVKLYNLSLRKFRKLRKPHKNLPLKKLANCVLPPLADMTELREKDAVNGTQPKKEQKMEPKPKAIISCVESVIPPFASN